MLLLAQPLGMLTMLLAAWPREVRAGLAALATRASGQIALGAGAALIAAGVVLATVRILDARGEPFFAGARDVASALTPVDDPAPALDLIDQHGQAIATKDFAGRLTFVTFAYAHCETVCPAVVSDVVAAARQLEDRKPAVVVVTLDPWRDTPARLPAMADAWRLPADAHVLSGSVDRVERVLSAWRVPRVRNAATGALSHPAIVYVVGPNGRIRYVATGGSDVIAAAAGAL
jgi:protein SCO1/2